MATFPEHERGPAIGSWTAWVGIFSVLGPLAGGELLAVASWRWIFVINLPLAVLTLTLILRLIPAPSPRSRARRVDWWGALLCGVGLAGPVFALIEQPRLGWSSPAVIVPLVGGAAVFGAFLLHEARAADPMLPLGLFKRHNFTVGNIETFSMYAGLAVLSFFLVLYLQQVAGYTPLQSGLALLPITLVMFALSRHWGALADRHGPRLFMAAGPLIAAAGLTLFLGVGTHVHYVRDVLPALLLFSLGLSMTVAPLTAAVLAGVDEQQAGIASGVNNAIARVAGLLAVAAMGAIIAARFAATVDAQLSGVRLTPAGHAAVAEAKRLPIAVPDVSHVPPAQARAITNAARGASRESFHLAMGVAAALVAAGGLTAAAGIRNPERVVVAATCEGGQLVGAPRDAAGCPEARERPIAA